MFEKLWSRPGKSKDPFAPGPTGSQRFARIAIVVSVVLLTIRLGWGCAAAQSLEGALEKTAQAGLPLRMTAVELPQVAPDEDAWPLLAELLRLSAERGVGMAPALARQGPLSAADQARLEQGRADEELLKNWQPGEPLEATWKQRMAERLAANADLLRLLAQAAQRPSIRWRVTEDPARPLEIDPLPLMTVARLTVAKAAIALDEGRPAEALEAVGVVFRTGLHIRQAPIVEMHPAEAGLLLDATAVLQKALPRLEPAPLARQALDRAMQDGPVAPTLRTATLFTQAWLHASYLAAVEGRQGVAQAIKIWAFRPYIDSSHAKALALLREVVPMIEGPYAQFIAPLEQRAARTGGGATGQWLGAIMQRVLGAAHSAAIARTLRAQTQIALALRTWQAEHGQLPESLDLLVGPGLPALPADPMTGGPFGYIRDGSAPRLYSAGIDRQDNQGTWDLSADPAGQKGHDLCFFLTGLPDQRAATTQPATAPAQ